MQQEQRTKQIHWWQSIRWRLALGSTLVALLATVLLASSILLVINISYSGDQRQQLNDIAKSLANEIGENYSDTQSLYQSSEEATRGLSTQSATGEEYLQLVYGPSRPVKLVYPRMNNGESLSPALHVLMTDSSLQDGDYSTVWQAIRTAQKGNATADQIGTQSRPFVVDPIFEDGVSTNDVIGVLLVIPRSSVDNTTPPFLSSVHLAILLVSLIVVLFAALVAILFSRTITRPLATLTNAAYVLAGGNYSTRVATGVQGELGELASSFNEMAARLEQDVFELRQQESRRRELIMNVTHDLATPLTALAGMGEALSDGISQNHEDFQETGRVIVRETLRLHRLVKDLHMMAKAETGAMQPQRRAVRLAPLVDEVFAALIPEFERVDVEPRNNLAYNLPTVWADPDMLSRVFDNLCSNALRYTPAGGNVTIDATPRDTTLVISVTDSGQGIPTGALPRIFDRFYRADPARQITTGGSGLGLAIVRAIVEAHGGGVWAENVLDSGARINFVLPIASASWEPLASEATLPLSFPPILPATDVQRLLKPSQAQRKMPERKSF